MQKIVETYASMGEYKRYAQEMECPEYQTCAYCGNRLSPMQKVWQSVEIFPTGGQVIKYFCPNECRCYPKNSNYPTYCPVHDGDYSKWKFGEYGEEWDE